jgi:peptidoglycan hydrolase-like protein with peptidoglycan-binding domain
VHGSRALVVTTVATVSAAAALVATALIGRPTPAQIVPTPEPVYVTVNATSSDRNQAVVVSADLSVAPAVRSAGATGVVTAVAVTAGDTVDDGVAVYSVDGAPVYAYISPTPLYRPLTVGDSGPDVAAIQGFLARRALLATSQDGRFGPATAAALRAWQRDFGLKPTGVVDPTRFVRLDAPGVVQTVNLSVGSVAPAIGDALLTLRPGITSLDVTPERDVSLGDYVVIASAGRATVSFDGRAWTPADPTALLAVLLTGEAQPTTDGAGTGETTPSDGSRHVRLDARLALAQPVAAVVVPPDALIASATGVRACVWRREGDTPVRVEGVVVSAITASGAALVDGPSLAGADVLLDPAAVLSDATCP